MFAGFPASFLGVGCCEEDTGQNGPLLWSSSSTNLMFTEEASPTLPSPPPIPFSTFIAKEYCQFWRWMILSLCDPPEIYVEMDGDLQGSNTALHSHRKMIVIVQFFYLTGPHRSFPHQNFRDCWAIGMFRPVKKRFWVTEAASVLFQKPSRNAWHRSSSVSFKHFPLQRPSVVSTLLFWFVLFFFSLC